MQSATHPVLAPHPQPESTYLLTQHPRESWYSVRRVQPAPHAIPAIPTLAMQVAQLGAPSTGPSDDPGIEAGRLLDILAYELAVPQHLGDVLFAQLGGPVALMPPADDDRPWAIRACIGTIVRGLADLNVFLMDTGHLTDPELLAFLMDVVLNSEYRGVGVQLFAVSEWSDGERPKVSNRDRHLPRPKQMPAAIL